MGTKYFQHAEATQGPKHGSRTSSQVNSIIREVQHEAVEDGSSRLSHDDSNAQASKQDAQLKDYVCIDSIKYSIRLFSNCSLATWRLSRERRFWIRIPGLEHGYRRDGSREAN